MINPCHQFISVLLRPLKQSKYEISSLALNHLTTLITFFLSGLAAYDNMKSKGAYSTYCGPPFSAKGVVIDSVARSTTF